MNAHDLKWFEQTLSYLAQMTLLSVIAAGLWLRARVAVSWWFLAYVITVLVGICLILVWPRYYLTFSMYVIRESTLVALKMCIAVEIWWRTFCSVRRARLHVGLLIVGLLAVTKLSTVHVPGDLEYYDAFIGILNARHQAGVSSLFAAVVLAATWYRVPLHPFHRALALGFAVYQVHHTFTLVGWTMSGGNVLFFRLMFPLEALGYPATLAWWAWAAWQPVRVPNPVVSRLQPWAPSW